MSNIVEKLRTAPVDNRPATLLNEAADYIEELEKKVREYHDALVSIQWKAQDMIRPVPFQDEEY